MTEIISYILSFLLGEKTSPETATMIGYTGNKNEFLKYKIVIYPSSFFNKEVYGTKLSLPKLPLKYMDNTPILYGEARTEFIGSTMVLYADIIASTYFLISRYEEMVNRESRDIHGRFPGKESLPYRAGFISRPIVDEYGNILRKKLRECGVDIQSPEEKIQHIYLTHDVDSIAHYRNIKSTLGSLLHFRNNSRETKYAITSYFKGIKYDPWFTFPWLIDKNNLLKQKLTEDSCKTIIFIKAGGGNRKEDKPHSDVRSKDFRYLFKLLNTDGSTIGLHASYEAGIHPDLISEEKDYLERTIGSKITYNRHHFLDSREPEDMQALINAEITDDFTMGYADIAGFRLGTCRAVKWINPVTKTLTVLTLHPLTIMDASLSEKKYMYLDEEGAYDYSVKLIENTKKFDGDLCLLWHNTSLAKNISYHRNLYRRIIDYLK